MASSALDPGRALRSYFVRFLLALLLTAVPFALVATHILEPALTHAQLAAELAFSRRATWFPFQAVAARAIDARSGTVPVSP